MNIPSLEANQQIVLQKRRPQWLRLGVFLVAFLIPPIGVTELFLDVSPGDSCRDIYTMETARGAEPGLPLEEMLHQGILGFERPGTQTREIGLYRCHENTVTSISHAVAFHTEQAQQRYFQEQRLAMETRFGEPALDTFNLSLWEKLVLWFERRKRTVEGFKTVYWTLEEGETASLSLIQRPSQDKKYVVSMDWEDDTRLPDSDSGPNSVPH